MTPEDFLYKKNCLATEMNSWKVDWKEKIFYDWCKKKLYKEILFVLSKKLI